MAGRPPGVVRRADHQLTRPADDGSLPPEDASLQPEDSPLLAELGRNAGSLSPLSGKLQRSGQPRPFPKV